MYSDFSTNSLFYKKKTETQQSFPPRNNNHMFFTSIIQNLNNMMTYYLANDFLSTPYPDSTPPKKLIDTTKIPNQAQQIPISRCKFTPLRPIDHGRPFQYEIVLLRGLHYRSDIWFSTDQNEKLAPPPSFIIISADIKIDTHLPARFEIQNGLVIQRVL